MRSEAPPCENSFSGAIRRTWWTQWKATTSAHCTVKVSREVFRQNALRPAHDSPRKWNMRKPVSQAFNGPRLCCLNMHEAISLISGWRTIELSRPRHSRLSCKDVYRATEISVDWTRADVGVAVERQTAVKRLFTWMGESEKLSLITQLRLDWFIFDAHNFFARLQSIDAAQSTNFRCVNTANGN